jgi:hypothetical protein
MYAHSLQSVPRSFRKASRIEATPAAVKEVAADFFDTTILHLLSTLDFSRKL